MRASPSRVAGILVGICALSTCVSSPALGLEAGAEGRATHIQLTEETRPPAGLVAFCALNREHCDHSGDSAIESEAPTASREATQGGSRGGSRFRRAPAPRAIEAAPATSHDQAEAPGDRPGRLALTEELRRDIQAVNRRINRQIRWRSDLETFGVGEYWTMPLSLGLGRAGDCEDFALEKRRALLELGVPAEALALATANSRATGHHAVLVLRTDQGDLVLDNATPWILDWRETGYQWLTMQSGADLMDWRVVASADDRA